MRLSDIAKLITDDIRIESPGLGEAYIGSKSFDGLFEQVGVRAGIKKFATTIPFVARDKHFVAHEKDNEGNSELDRLQTVDLLRASHL